MDSVSISQGFIVASPQLTSNTEFIGSLGIQCPPRNSFAVVPGKSVERSEQTFFVTIFTFFNDCLMGLIFLWWCNLCYLLFSSPKEFVFCFPAGHQQLFQKVATATVTPGAYGGVHSSEVQQISNNPVSLSSVQGPAVYATSSNQLQSDQSNSQALSVSVSRPRFTVLELESTGTSNKQ